MFVAHSGMMPPYLDKPDAMDLRINVWHLWKYFGAFKRNWAQAHVLRLQSVCSSETMPVSLSLYMKQANLGEADNVRTRWQWRYWRCWQFHTMIVLCTRCSTTRLVSKTQRCAVCRRHFCCFRCPKLTARFAHQLTFEIGSASDLDLVSCLYDDVHQFCGEYD